MREAFVLVWGIALLMIVGLGAWWWWDVRRQVRSSVSDASGAVGFQSRRDILLFYYDKSVTRSTADEQIVVHLRGIAWEVAWQSDWLRVEITRLDPQAIRLSAGQSPFLAFRLDACRMTDDGRDIPVLRFAAPIEVAVLLEKRQGTVQLWQTDPDQNGWVLAAPPRMPPEEWLDTDRASLNWAAAWVQRPIQLCLTQAN